MTLLEPSLCELLEETVFSFAVYYFIYEIDSAGKKV